MNNSIKKYGIHNFTVEIIEYCSENSVNKREKFYIEKYKSLFPLGYNLNTGGQNFTHTKESKKRVSNGVIKYYYNKKLNKFNNIKIIFKDNIKDHIKPLNRENKQYGWYVYFGPRLKTDFGGVHITLEESYQNALIFIQTLKEKQDSETP